MQNTTIAKPTLPEHSSEVRAAVDIWAIGAAFGFTVFAGMLGILLWGLDRGWDPLVEGFYMLSSQNPQIYPTFSSFHFFLHAIPPFIANEIIRFRVVELACRISGALLLSYGFCRWSSSSLKLTFAKKMFLTSVACVGALFSLSFFPRTCSYNGLSSFFIVASVGFMFLGLAPQKASGEPGSVQNSSAKFLAPIFLFVSGFLAGFDVFDKFTSGLGLLAVVAVFLFTERRMRSIAFVLLGVIASAAVYFGFFQSASEWWRVFIEAVRLESSSSHQISYMPLDAAALLKTYTKHVCGLLLSVLVFTELFKKAKAQRNVFRLLVGTYGLVLVVMAATAAYIPYETYGIILTLATLFTGLFYAIMSDLNVGRAKPSVVTANSATEVTANNATASLSDKAAASSEIAKAVTTDPGNLNPGGATATDSIQRNADGTETLIGKPLLAGMALVLLLPCLVSAGTNTDPIVHVGGTLAPWFLLVGLGCLFCAKKYAAPYTASLVAACLLLFSLVHFVHQGVFTRQESKDLTQCTEPVHGVPALDGIKLLPRDSKAYEQALQLLKANGFQAGDPIICLYDQPGLLYAMGATSPGQAWYIYWPERDELNAHYMEQAHLADAKRVFLITTCKNCFGDKLMSVLNKQGFSFATFTDVGKVENPLIHGNHMHFYVHQKAGKQVVPKS